MFEIVPFHEELLPQAGELLARRHARDRADMPLLPARFETPRTALGAVREVWHRAWSRGVAALRDGRLAGFLLGEAQFDTLRGRHAWVPLAGHALAADAPVDLYGELYAVVGSEWLRLGAFDHYVMMPAGDRAGLEAWFALSFGQEQCHALRSLVAGEAGEDAGDPGLLPEGVRIRRATADDRDVMVEEMSPLLRQHLAGPPVWGAALPEYAQEIREGFAEMLTDETVHVWLAERTEPSGGSGRVLGYQAYFPASHSDHNLSIPDRAVVLNVAATRPEARRLGVGRALTRAGLADAAAGGYAVCVADWRTTNLEAQRFWPRLGFRPAVYRLTRKVDPRIAWAG
ncbi:N-acetyltransferase family protein [Promineifilum sp.]|uniref:GNAT family N-acetyltransferase n=1 Tax=Promineifilum sp. TaxID=2664178 RepID=UPI0035B26954